MPFCICCGNKLTEEANFCPNCGFRAHEQPHSPNPFDYDEDVDILRELSLPLEDNVSSPEPPSDEQEALYAREECIFPQEPPVPSEVADTPHHTARHAAIVALAFALSLLLVAMSAVCSFRLASAKERLYKIVSRCDLSEFPAATLIADASADTDLVCWLRGMLIRLDSAWETVSERDLERYLDAFIKPFLAEKLGEFSDDLFAGRAQASISKKELTKLLASGRDYLEVELGIPLSDAQLARIVSWLVASGVTDYADMQYWNWQYPKLLPAIRLFSSWWFLALLGAFSLLAACVIVSLAHSAERSLRVLGAVTTSVGTILAILSFLSIFSPTLWLGICRDNATAAFLLQTLLRAGISVTLGIFSVGIVLLAARAILVRMCKKAV